MRLPNKTIKAWFSIPCCCINLPGKMLLQSKIEYTECNKSFLKQSREAFLHGIVQVRLEFSNHSWKQSWYTCQSKCHTNKAKELCLWVTGFFKIKGFAAPPAALISCSLSNLHETKYSNCCSNIILLLRPQCIGGVLLHIATIFATLNASNFVFQLQR